jgi:hypothetical protein
MISAWIVVREERHLDDKFWVCLELDDAIKIANDVTSYWIEKYQPDADLIDDALYENQKFHYDAEDMFRVMVMPQTIRESGETADISE